jgi:hypothetical protein
MGSKRNNVAACVVEFFNFEPGERFFGWSLEDFPLWSKAGLVARTFEKSFFFPMVDLAAEMGAFTRYGPGAFLAFKKNKIGAQKKTTREQHGLDFKYPGLGRDFETEKTEDWITQGQQRNNKKKSSSRKRLRGSWF